MLAEAMLARNLPVDKRLEEPDTGKFEAGPVPADVNDPPSPGTERVGDLVAAEEARPLTDKALELDRAGKLG